MEKVYDKFEILQSINLMKVNDDILPNLSNLTNLTEFYDEFSKDGVMVEIKRLRRHIQASNINKKEVEKWSSFAVHC
jgi:hypothetical protein